MKVFLRAAAIDLVLNAERSNYQHIHASVADELFLYQSKIFQSFSPLQVYVQVHSHYYALITNTELKMIITLIILNCGVEIIRQGVE